MIAYLSGTVKATYERTLILNANGVGYLINVNEKTLDKFEPDQSLELYIHTNVREDDISLYGFETHEEWHMFKLLVSVSGVGPRSALEILNEPLNKVRSAIARKQVPFLIGIKGIGRKSAERICIDLEAKMRGEELEELAAETGTKNQDIIDALMSMGYKRNHVVQSLKKIPAEITDEESIIKYFLQNS